MNGLIIACGRKDSRGNDRLIEPRGLLRFDNREVVAHTVDKMAEAGVSSVGILTERGLKEKYEAVFETESATCPVHVEESSGHNSLSAYMYGTLKFSQGDPLIAIADDNLFTFSLAPLVASSLQRGGSVLTVRDRSVIDGDIDNLNLGEVVVDRYGKITRFRNSFTNEKRLHSRLIALDIWVLHPRTISSMAAMVEANSPPATLIEIFLNDLYCHEINDGFWADVGKEPLRHSAALHFSKGSA